MKNKDTLLMTTLALLVLASFVVLYNTYALTQIGSQTVSASVTVPKAAGIIPAGIPEIYGQELGIRYDDVSPSDQRLADATIRKMSQYENNDLSTEQNSRYIDILYNLNNGISCEYCCGARSIIFENGQRACGCAHSYAMRGLTKYLLIEHGDEYTDAEIQAEVAKWKTLFFPQQMQSKAQIMQENDLEVTYESLGSNQYRGIEEGVKSAGQMVGGC